jgi:hypothetical protein
MKRRLLIHAGEVVSTLDTLDKFMGINQEVSMVKVDMEGNECHVLQGSLHFFENRLV